MARNSTRTSFFVGAFALTLASSLAFAAVRRNEPVRRDEPEELVRSAQAAREAKDWTRAAELALDALRRVEGTPDLHELVGVALLELDRDDEAAHHLELALRGYEAARANEKVPPTLALLRRADPLSQRRDAFVQKITSTLTEAAAGLLKEGSAERALQLLERLAPLARGKDAARAQELLGRAREAFQAVDLDREGEEAPESGVREFYELESEHYRFATNLEPSVVKRLAKVMDDIHGYYVRIYFDGDAKKAVGEKALIRILPDHATMMQEWSGGSTPQGWWSPAANEVVTYDTRTDAGTLDPMLDTLFHEASHQFMDLLARGGFTPAWLNEGTASFFEGAVAMADGRVLWPSAAVGRLRALSHQLENEPRPTPREVVEFAQGGSYPAEYYSYGWGLAYFFQQYEAPTTFEYVYRPLFAEYRTKVIAKGGEPMRIFEEVFLGKASPLGHATFDDFVRDWRKWILDEVRPLYVGDARTRELRLAKVATYLTAADEARADKKNSAKRKRAGTDEEAFLLRALGHVEYVRTKVDKPDATDGELLVRQADVLERLNRPKSAAPLIEQALELADRGKFALDAERAATLERRLAKLDTRSAAVRSSRVRVRELTQAARALLVDYRANKSPSLHLRGYTFASQIGGLLQDGEGLIATAVELRKEARARGLLLGSVRPLRAEKTAWNSSFSTIPERFEISPRTIDLASTRACGFVDTSVDVTGEYVVSGTFKRKDGDIGAAVGLVVAAQPTRDWTMIGIDDRGKLGLYVLKVSARGGSTFKRTTTLPVSPAIEPDETPRIVVRVGFDGTMSIKVGDREPVTAPLVLDPSLVRHVGIFTKSSGVEVDDLVVEIAP